MNYWRCDECDWRGNDDEMLRAPNPFDPEWSLTGCPECKQVNAFTNVCDEPGCRLDAGCGWKPRGAAYRRTCGAHMGSALLSAGYSLADVGAVLEHKSAQSTKRYSIRHSTAEHCRD
jgi:hypothetical protein